MGTNQRFTDDNGILDANAYWRAIKASGVIQYPPENAWGHTTAQLMLEALELDREILYVDSDEDKRKALAECGDVLFYIAQIAELAGVQMYNASHDKYARVVANRLRSSDANSRRKSGRWIIMNNIKSSAEQILKWHAKKLRLDDRPFPEIELTRLWINLSTIIYYLDSTPPEVAAKNYEKLTGRLDRGTIRGDGDER